MFSALFLFPEIAEYPPYIVIVLDSPFVLFCFPEDRAEAGMEDQGSQLDVKKSVLHHYFLTRNIYIFFHPLSLINYQVSQIYGYTDRPEKMYSVHKVTRFLTYTNWY